MIIDKDLQDCVVIQRELAEGYFFAAFKVVFVETRKGYRIYEIQLRYDCDVIESIFGDIVVKDSAGFESLNNYIIITDGGTATLEMNRNASGFASPWKVLSVPRQEIGI